MAMSSRALRKLQREQELQKQLAAVKAAEEDGGAGTDEEEAHPVQPERKPLNAFHMLEGGVEEDHDNDEESEMGDEESSAPGQRESHRSSTASPAPRSKSKKKKKKAKKKANEKTREPPAPGEESGDEIDRALKEISAKKNTENQTQTELVESQAPSSWEISATKLLAINTKNLNPVNEMRSLFGNIALEGQESRSTPRQQRRREQNLQGGVDLATALTGRYSAASRGRELGALASRKNVFVQGKEEWPLATSGGLSMEYDPGPSTFERHYNILHNTTYQETQMHFKSAVESMDPQRMVGLLIVYPYHIATLLQVSEIAKHQGDHSVSGDLIERALFSFGRSVQSSFPAALREGRVRMSFANPANRELYLTIWRYIRNLEMRGTWRTAFEWAKLLLQLDTISDPYGVTLMIDQLALRGRQHDRLVALCSEDGYGNAWKHLPNIQISLALAYLRTGKPRDARRQLAWAMYNYPYVLSALASALDISPLPKVLWAKLPSTDAEKLYTQLYVTRAKDLWNTPETTSLLVEVADTLEHYYGGIRSPTKTPRLEISLEEARHVMLLEIPALIALLPRRFTTMPTSSADVLPPPDSASDFVVRAPADGSGASAMQALFNAAGATIGATGGILQRILNLFQTPAGPNDADNALRDLQLELGPDVPPEILEQLLEMHLQEADEGHDITPAGLGMDGNWDYYEEAANDLSSNDDDSSMPDLEDAPGPQHPRAAMVEEEVDDDAHSGPSGITTGHAVLRHVDSDEDEVEVEEEVGSHPLPTHRVFTPTTPSESPPAAPVATEVDENDPQRVQRWLLSAGLTELQDNPTTLGSYVRRLKMLRKQQQAWVVNMVRQRAGPAVADRVKNAVSD